jgi:hypothetical protein
MKRNFGRELTVDICMRDSSMSWDSANNKLNNNHDHCRSAKAEEGQDP